MKHDYTSTLQINSSLDERIIAGESELNRMSEMKFTGEINLLRKLGVLVPSVDASATVEFHFIRNTDGSIRWIWEAGCSTPEFLSFYHAGNVKSRIFKVLAKLAFTFKLGSFFKHGAFTTSGWKLNRELNFKALFTGTAGPNRKAIAKAIVNGETIFFKYAESDEAISNLKNEDFALRELADSSCSNYFNFPQVFETGNNSIFAQSGLPLGKLETALKPADLNLLAFLRWQKYTMSPAQPHFDESLIFESRFSNQLIQQLALLSDWCKINSIEKSCWNHGDFTPWNCKVKNGELFIFDWEMFTRKGVPLADLFHFIYQQAILVDRVGYKEIRSRIDEMIALPQMQEFLIQNDLNPLVLERHYLNQVVIYYLGVYSKQEVWHTQVNWLLNTWTQALNYHLATDTEDLRSAVLDSFQSKMPDFNLALLKFKSGNLKDVSETSDFDICTTKSEAGKIIEFFRNDSRVELVKVRDLYKMQQIEITLLNGSRIYLDLIFKFRRKHIDFLSASEVLLTRNKLENGIWVASPAANEKYISGFYLLNNSEIPAKYAVEFMSEKSGNNVEEILSRRENRGFRKLKNRLEYIFEFLESMKSEKGFLVTFSGVDGAGKSTIIENVKLELEKKHRRRVVVIRHRPSILPIISALKYGKKNAEQRSASTLPRQGENSGKLSSLLRFSYYLFDYVFGQWVIHFRYVRKGVIVLPR
ncbi:MAG: hypothetical protein R2850_09280 [Bacteroidia bacterium]